MTFSILSNVYVILFEFFNQSTNIKHIVPVSYVERCNRACNIIKVKCCLVIYILNFCITVDYLKFIDVCSKIFLEGCGFGINGLAVSEYGTLIVHSTYLYLIRTKLDDWFKDSLFKKNLLTASHKDVLIVDDNRHIKL